MPNPYDELTNADITRVSSALGSVLELLRKRLPEDFAPAFHAPVKSEAAATAKL
jgi:hypothetical protein